LEFTTRSFAAEQVSPAFPLKIIELSLFRLLRNRNGQVGSALTTPPNSPEAEMSSEFEYNKKPKKWIFYRFEVIVGLFVSNLMTFVIGATIG
jgi:hypothetical protein